MKNTYFVVYSWNYNFPKGEFETLREAKEYSKTIPEGEGFHIIEYDKKTDLEVKEIC